MNGEARDLCIHQRAKQTLPLEGQDDTVHFDGRR